MISGSLRVYDPSGEALIPVHPLAFQGLPSTTLHHGKDQFLPGLIQEEQRAGLALDRFDGRAKDALQQSIQVDLRYQCLVDALNHSAARSTAAS